MLIMLVKCMLPLFLVENKYFQKWIQTIDHSFRFPSRKTLKTTYLDNLMNVVKTKHKSSLTMQNGSIYQSMVGQIQLTVHSTDMLSSILIWIGKYKLYRFHLQHLEVFYLNAYNLYIILSV